MIPWGELTAGFMGLLFLIGVVEFGVGFLRRGAVKAGDGADRDA